MAMAQKYLEMSFNYLSHRRLLPYFFLAILIISGSCLRLHNLSNHTLGIDDYEHVELSTVGSRSEVFINSYKDAHPPLRNMILRELCYEGCSPLKARLVALVPGVLLIPTIFFVALGLLNSFSAASFAAMCVTFSPLLIRVSQGTRPYSLVCLFGLLFILSSFKLIKNFSYAKILLNFIIGIIFATCNYESAIVIAAVSIIISFNLIRQKQYRNVIIWIFNIALITGWYAFEAKLFLLSKSQYTPKRLYYLVNYYRLSFKSFLYYTLEFSQKPFINRLSFDLFGISSSFLVMTGFLSSAFKGNKNVFCLLSLSVAFNLLTAQLYLYPYSATRHGSLLSLIFILTAASGFTFLIKFNLLSKLAAALLIGIFSYNYYLTVRELTKANFLSDISLIEFGMSRSEFLETKSFLKKQLHPEDHFISYRQASSFLIQNEFVKEDSLLEEAFYPNVLHIDTLRTKRAGFYCSIKKTALTPDMFSKKFWCLALEYTPKDELSIIANHNNFILEDLWYPQSRRFAIYSFRLRVT